MADSIPANQFFNQNTSTKKPVSAASFMGNGGLTVVSSPDSSSIDSSQSTSNQTYIPGSVKQWEDQSAQPASTEANPTPNWWQKIVAGTPLAPANTKDIATPGAVINGNIVGGSQGDIPSLIGKTMLNTITDSVPAAIGFINLFELWKYPAISKAVYKAAAGATKETVAALEQGVKTGDWSRLDNDGEKAEITMANHPLQTVLFFDGGIEGISKIAGGISDISSSITDPNTSFGDTDTGKSIKSFTNKVSDVYKASTDPNTSFGDTDTGKNVIKNIDAARNNIANLFKTRTTLSEHTVALGNLMDAYIENNKALTEGENNAKTFNDKNNALLEENKKLQEQVKQSQEGAQEKLTANEQAQEDLKQEKLAQEKKLQAIQDKAKENFKNRKAEVDSETSNQQKEAKLKNGFNSSDIEATQAVSNLGEQAYNREDTRYNENLGNVPINTGGIIDSIKNYASELYKGGKDAAAKIADTVSEKLKLRQIMSNYNGNDIDLYNQLRNSGINNKLWEKLNPDELQRQYPPVTSNYLKQIKNSIFDSVTSDSDKPSIKQYQESVKPAFDQAFDDAFEKVGGKEKVALMKSIDAAWAKLKSSPIFSEKGNIPSFNKLDNNWNSFVKDASTIPGGPGLIERLQNFAYEKILNNAEDPVNKGTFDVKKLAKGMSDYGHMIGDELSSRLQRVIDDNKSIVDNLKTAIESGQQQKTSIKEDLSNKKSVLDKAKTVIKKTAADLSDMQKSLVSDQKQIESDAKDIGSDEPDIAKKIDSINSPEKLDDYVKKTGKTAVQIFNVFTREALSGFKKGIGATSIEPELDTKGNPVLKDGKPVLKLPNFDIKDIKGYLDSVKKLGGNSQEVLDKFLGKTPEMIEEGKSSDAEKEIKKLQTQYDEWEKAPKGKGKTLMGRALNLTAGTLIVTLMPFGKLYGIRKILSAFYLDSTPDEINTQARTIAPEGNAFSTKKAGTILKTGTIANTAKQEEQKEDSNSQ